MNIKKFRCSLASLLIIAVMLIGYAIFFFTHTAKNPHFSGPSFSAFPTINTAFTQNPVRTVDNGRSTRRQHNYEYTHNRHSTVATTTTTSAAIPNRVLITLAKIDAHQWPPPGHPRTHGGATWFNREHLLPLTTHNHVRISYQEWDVNISDHGRDAERIITGSDGSAYYTLNHYRSFIRIR